MDKAILFVCLGNICRSPTAEGVFRALADAAGVQVRIDSAGTAGWHTGNPPYPEMMQTAAARGYDIGALRARQFSTADFRDFDLIIGMDSDNIRDIEALRPAGNETPVRLFLSYLPDVGLDNVPDPYFTRDFETAIDLIEDASKALLRNL